MLREENDHTLNDDWDKQAYQAAMKGDDNNRTKNNKDVLRIARTRQSKERIEGTVDSHTQLCIFRAQHHESTQSSTEASMTQGFQDNEIQIVVCAGSHEHLKPPSYDSSRRQTHVQDQQRQAASA